MDVGWKSMPRGASVSRDSTAKFVLMGRALNQFPAERITRVAKPESRVSDALPHLSGDVACRCARTSTAHGRDRADAGWLR